MVDLPVGSLAAGKLLSVSARIKARMPPSRLFSFLCCLHYLASHLKEYEKSNS